MKEIIKDKAVAYSFNSIVMLNSFDKASQKFVILNLFQNLKFLCEPVCKAQHLKIKRFRNKFGMTFGHAFTLAEVLITLTIIGVIAALTIPNLMQKWSDHADVVKVKEAYSIINNALRMAIAENGNLDEWAWPEAVNNSDANSLFLANELAKKLNIYKFCGLSSGCFLYGYSSSGALTTSETSNHFKTNTGSIATGSPIGNNKAKMILKNGMRVAIVSYTNMNNAPYDMAYIILDINGNNKPNQLGYDVFYFGIQNNGLVPQYNGKAWNDGFNKAYFCQKTVADGRGCSRWIIRKGNMDYKYRDVSAEW